MVCNREMTVSIFVEIVPNLVSIVVNVAFPVVRFVFVVEQQELIAFNNCELSHPDVASVPQ